MSSSESEEKPGPAESPAPSGAKSEEPAWPPLEARPEEPPAAATPETAPTPGGNPAISTEAATSEPATASSGESSGETAPDKAGEGAASEPAQEMGLSESTLHWLVDGEQAVEPRLTSPETERHYDPRAPVAGRKRTFAVIGGAAVLALIVAAILHGQAERHGPVPSAPAPAEPAAVLTRQAEAALAQGRGNEAMELAHLALVADPRFADAYVVVGALQRDSGRLNEARDAYRKYLELAPLGTHATEARKALTALPP